MRQCQSMLDSLPRMNELTSSVYPSSMRLSEARARSAGADPVAGEPGADEDPGEVGVAEPPFDAIRRRRRLPVEGSRNPRGQPAERASRGSPRRGWPSSSSKATWQAGRMIGPSRAVTRQFQAVSRRLQPSPIAQAVERLDPVERPGERPRKPRPVAILQPAEPDDPAIDLDLPGRAVPRGLNASRAL